MKSILAMMILVATMVAAPVMAEEGNLSDATLSSLGLGSLQVLSDANGMEVRGMSSSSQASSLSFASFLIFDPNTGASWTGQVADFGRGTAENAGLSITSVASAQSAGGFTAFSTSVSNGTDTFTAMFDLFGSSGSSMAMGQ